MRQVVVANGQFLGSFLLRDDPGQESRLLAVAAVPLGVLLPFGLTWQIDGGKPIRVPFMLCDPQSCATQLVINEAYVNSLKKGGMLKLTAKNRQNEDLVIEINLAGFTAVYDSDTALTFDQFTQETTGPTALEQMLQDRAEQLRQELTGEAPADGTAPAPDGATPPAEHPRRRRRSSNCKGRPRAPFLLSGGLPDAHADGERLLAQRRQQLQRPEPARAHAPAPAASRPAASGTAYRPSSPVRARSPARRSA